MEAKGQNGKGRKFSIILDFYKAPRPSRKDMWEHLEGGWRRNFKG
jgi:hypothetical protein